MSAARRANGGVSLIETLAAVIIVGIVAAAAIATWGISSSVASNKRATEMANYLGTREIERLKAKAFANLPVSAVDGSGNPIATVTYYDKTGATVIPFSHIAGLHGRIDRCDGRESVEHLRVRQTCARSRFRYGAVTGQHGTTMVTFARSCRQEQCKLDRNDIAIPVQTRNVVHRQLELLAAAIIDPDF